MIISGLVILGFLGVHFFNPVPLMKLVEVIPTEQTNITFIDDVISTLKSWKKTVVTAKDTPGFIVNRIARPYYGEALRIYEEGIADFVTIDWAMKKFGGFRMGPFELMDYIGNDVNYNATEAIFIGSNYNPRYKPSPTQKCMVDDGLLGQKSGKGYYDYSDNGSSDDSDYNWEPQQRRELNFNRSGSDNGNAINPPPIKSDFMLTKNLVVNTQKNITKNIINRTTFKNTANNNITKPNKTKKDTHKKNNKKKNRKQNRNRL